MLKIRILPLQGIALVFSNLGYATKGTIASLVFKDISKAFAHFAITCIIESLEKMKDCDRKRYLISQYQEILERNAKS